MPYQKITTGPTVSVVMPVYNAARFLTRAIASVLAQSLPDIELIAVNDGSTDDSGDILHSIRDPRVTVLQQSNRGTASARNRALMRARGDFVAFLDADDEWLPEKLELQIQQFQAHPAIDVVYSDCYLIDADGRCIGRYDMHIPHEQDKLAGLFIHDYIPMLTLMVRRTLLDRVGLFDETIRVNEDFEFKMRLVNQGTIEYCDSPLAKYRLSPQQKTAQKEMFPELFNLTERLVQHYPSLASVKNKRLAINHSGFGRQLFQEGNFKEARRHYARALRLYPYDLTRFVFLSFAWPGIASAFNCLRALRRKLIAQLH